METECRYREALSQKLVSFSVCPAYTSMPCLYLSAYKNHKHIKVVKTVRKMYYELLSHHFIKI